MPAQQLLSLTLSFLGIQTIDTGEHLTRSFVQVIEEQTTRTFQSVDQTLQLKANQQEKMWLARSMSEESTRLLFRQALDFTPFVRMFSYRTLSKHPELVVAVGQSCARLLKPWRQLTWLELTLWVAAGGGYRWIS